MYRHLTHIRQAVGGGGLGRGVRGKGDALGGGMGHEMEGGSHASCDRWLVMCLG